MSERVYNKHLKHAAEMGIDESFLIEARVDAECDSSPRLEARIARMERIVEQEEEGASKERCEMRLAIYNEVLDSRQS